MGPLQPHTVVGVDGSPESCAALRWAVDHGRRTGTTVRAVRVWHPPAEAGVVAEPPGALIETGAIPTWGPRLPQLSRALRDLEDDALRKADQTIEAVRDDHQRREAQALEAIVAQTLAGGEGAAGLETVVVEGDAPTVLVDLAANADLLVLGSRGHGRIAGAVLGSVAQRCVHGAPCPVVIVPAAGRPPAATGARDISG